MNMFLPAQRRTVRSLRSSASPIQAPIKGAVQGASVFQPRIRMFVTVGTELPFDRLVRAVDDFAGRTGLGSEVVAQIGETSYRPANIRWSKFIHGADYADVFDRAELIVSHAGMGTILSALRDARPLIVMPRRASLGEHRNEHQLATAERMTAIGGVNVADDEIELIRQLESGEQAESLSPIGPHADDSLITAIRDRILVPA